LDYVAGVVILVSRVFIDDNGLMAEDYFLYCEEIDWTELGCRSAKKNGKLGFVRESAVLHKVGANPETGLSAAATRFFYTSKLRPIKRFYPPRYRSIVLVILLQGVNKLRKC
jgi:GT2 family glycosyltransferase